MEAVLANINDLNTIKQMYNEIIKDMYSKNIKIWNEFYPNEIFQEDIEKENLYILKNDNDIIAVFSLTKYSEGEKNFEWEDKNSNVIYIDRLGVNVNYLHKGFGKRLLEKAIIIAKQKNAQYLRLLVVDVNIPAIKLYLKTGFKRVDGMYEERINENIILKEYGFEIKIDNY